LARHYLSGKNLGVVAHACHPSKSRKFKIGGSNSMMAPAKKQVPVSKITIAKRAGGVAQVVKYQLS
jgi:hypothetical protein